MFYIIQDMKVVNISESKPRTTLEVVESEEMRKIGDSYIDEFFGDPIKTFDEELAELNSTKRSQEKEFAEKYALILGRNGGTEGPAKTAIRANLLAKIDADYLSEKTALELKYFGE